MSEEMYAETMRGWVIDSICFEHQIAKVVGCDIEYYQFETHFVFKGHKLGGWTFEGIRDAIERGYSKSFCTKLINELLNRKVEFIKS